MGDRAKPFRFQLRDALDETGVTVSELSRRIADQLVAADPESVRRLIYKHLDGTVTPGEPMRHAYARALGLPPDFFSPGSSEENFDVFMRRFTKQMNSYTSAIVA